MLLQISEHVENPSAFEAHSLQVGVQAPLSQLMDVHV